jgi:acyl carrier protein
MEEKVLKLIYQYIGPTDLVLTKETHLIDDLGYDSLDLIELVMAIEEATGYTVVVPNTSPNTSIEWATVGDVLQYISKNNITW